MRVLLASPGSDIRLSLMLLLTQQPNIDVSGSTDSALGLLALVRATNPDAVVLDIALPGENILQLIAVLTKLPAQTKIILLADDFNVEPYPILPNIAGVISPNDAPQQVLQLLHTL